MIILSIVFLIASTIYYEVTKETKSLPCVDGDGDINLEGIMCEKTVSDMSINMQGLCVLIFLMTSFLGLILNGGTKNDKRKMRYNIQLCSHNFNLCYRNFNRNLPRSWMVIMRNYKCTNCKRPLTTEDNVVCPAPCQCGYNFKEVKEDD